MSVALVKLMEMPIKSAKKSQKTVADFFAGIGLVSMGLDRAGWETVYALDYDANKAAAYKNHFTSSHYAVQDIAKTAGKEIPNVTLAHASFPCTDLSVAGARKGIHHGESSSFWEFLRIISEMKKYYGDGRPPFILLENVEGLITSNAGQDMQAVLMALNKLGYAVDLLRIDASHFVPQSRVRIFIVGIHDSVLKRARSDFMSREQDMRSTDARSKKIVEYIIKHPEIRWHFQRLPDLPKRKISLEEIIDESAAWWSKERSEYLRKQMHPHHKALIEERINDAKYSYFPAFRRMRTRAGKKQSTAELRTDGIAGCLRTPKGGSARQILVRVGRGNFDARLFNEREAARLMGASDFKLNPSLSLNQVLFGFGDAVCVPAVEWLAKNYLTKLL